MYDDRAHAWEQFVDGYRDIRPISEADLRAVSTFHGISRLWTFGLNAQNAWRWGVLPMSDYYMDTYLNSLREWEEQLAQ